MECFQVLFQIIPKLLFRNVLKYNMHPYFKFSADSAQNFKLFHVFT